MTQMLTDQLLPWSSGWWRSGCGIRESFGLEGTLMLVSFQHCHGQGHLPLDQGVPNPTQPDLEQFQGWGIHDVGKESNNDLY